MYKDGFFFYPLSGDDLEGLYRLLGDDNAAFHLRAPRANDCLASTEDILISINDWISAREEDFANNRGAYFAVQKRGCLVAVTGLEIQPEHYRSGRILLAVDSGERGSGLAKMVVSLLSTWAINEIGLARLEVSTPGNDEIVRSLALSSGFEEEKKNTFSRLSPANQLIGKNTELF